MDSLNTILFDKNFDVPSEIGTIKAYVKRHFHADVNVKIGQQAIIISTPSAALAGSLRMHLHLMQKEIDTKKRLILRIQ